MAIFNEKGQQIPDPTPIEVPLNFKRPLSIQEEIKRFVRSEFSQRAVDQGHESFEEADDFDVEDEEGEFASPYEFTEMQQEAPFRDASDLMKKEPGDEKDSQDRSQVGVPGVGGGQPLSGPASGGVVNVGSGANGGGVPGPGGAASPPSGKTG